MIFTIRHYIITRMETDKFRSTMDKWFPNPRTPVNERFRASIGFDFIFYKNKQGRRKISCVETNGHNSGIRGAANIADANIGKLSKTLAGVRAMASSDKANTIEALNARRTEIISHTSNGYGPDDLELLAMLYNYIKAVSVNTKTPLMSTAIPNALDLEEAINNKIYHAFIVPKSLRPAVRGYDKTYDFPASGIWLLKPVFGERGEGIKAYKRADQAEPELPAVDPKFVWHEFISPLPADNAPDAYKSHPASMRYLVDFIKYNDGHTEKLYEFAYQRVSPFGVDSGRDFEDVYVVNKARKALAVHVSSREILQARRAAGRIIDRIDKYFLDITQYNKKAKAKFILDIGTNRDALVNFVNSFHENNKK